MTLVLTAAIVALLTLALSRRIEPVPRGGPTPPDRQAVIPTDRP